MPTQSNEWSYWFPLITAAIGFCSAVVGGLVVAIVNHLTARKRELAAKNREVVLTKLVRAWELLDDASQKGAKPANFKNFEEIVQLLLLYGKENEIEKVERIYKEIAALEQGQRDYVSWGDLQKILRDRVRSELGLEPLAFDHKWFYHEKMSPAPSSPEGEGREGALP